MAKWSLTGGSKAVWGMPLPRFRVKGEMAVVDKFSSSSLFPGDEDGRFESVVSSRVFGQESPGCRADINKSREVEAAITEALKKFGKVDILVHCAAIRGPVTTPIVELAEEDWRRVIDINLTGAFLIAKTVAKSMIAKGEGGKIVLVASMGGVKGMPGSAGYCAAKFGVIGLVKTLALELAKYKIFVNAINPGAFATNLRDSFHLEKGQAEGITTDEARERDYQKLIEAIPLGRMGTTEEIANLVFFLVSDQSSYITGEAINISGGVN
jgi:NAD(P)-dependent dehydrogenase (short-subunit alcohol dehydrogenase family)